MPQPNKLLSVLPNLLNELCYKITNVEEEGLYQHIYFNEVAVYPPHNYED